jgi:hypothetical protein
MIDLIFDLELKYSTEIQYASEMLTNEGITINRNKLLFNIDSAYKAICKYLDYTGEHTSDYIIPTIELAIVYYNQAQGFDKVTQKSQGSRSESISTTSTAIDSNGLTQKVKSMLPLPKLKVI